MRFLPFLLVLPSLYAAVAGYVVIDKPHISSTLSTRADKTPDNPDGEDDYQDPVTKANVPRSRILPFGQNGVDQPPEARDRWFDWDMTCTDTDDRQKIMTAFTNAYALAERASGALDALIKGLPSPAGTGSNAVRVNQNYIAAEDPAYTQMWFAQDNRLAQVKKSFDTIYSQVTKKPDDRAKGKGALRLICDKGGNVKAQDEKTSYCGTGPTAAHAIANNAGNDQPIEPKYVFAHSASIVLCPSFFDDTKFPNLPDILSDFDHHKTLDLMDCREEIMLHELCHLKWTLNIYQPDNIGFLKAAQTAGKGSGKRRSPDWANAKGNADNYAWYALYSYWNRLPNWGEETCKNDAWPQGTAKPNPTSF